MRDAELPCHERWHNGQVAREIPSWLPTADATPSRLDHTILAECSLALFMIRGVSRNLAGTPPTLFREFNRGGLVERADVVRQILLKRVAKAGLKRHLAEPFSPHGLRGGFDRSSWRRFCQNLRHLEGQFVSRCATHDEAITMRAMRLL